MITCRDVCLYNWYLYNTHRFRLNERIEDIYKAILRDPLPRSCTSLPLEVAGVTIQDSVFFTMPTIKYQFKR